MEKDNKETEIQKNYYIQEQREIIDINKRNYNKAKNRSIWRSAFLGLYIITATALFFPFIPVGVVLAGVFFETIFIPLAISGLTKDVREMQESKKVIEVTEKFLDEFINEKILNKML